MAPSHGKLMWNMVVPPAIVNSGGYVPARGEERGVGCVH